MQLSRFSPLYFRNFVFGVEDSLVSTVGLLSGIAVAGVERDMIFLTGVVLILVEAFSMAAGSFLSERSAQEYEAGAEVTGGRSFLGGVVMFVSYGVAGFVPLFPYVVFEPAAAFQLSIIYSLSALFALGLLSGALSRTRLLKSALRMTFIGGIAILAGIAAGTFLA